MKSFLVIAIATILFACNANQTTQQKVETDSTKKSSGKVDKRSPAPNLGTLTDQEAQAFYLGTNAVIWAYPAAFFEDLMRGRAAEDAEVKTGNPRSQVNQFGLVRHLRGPEFKQVATPNNDTYYAQAYSDVTKEPLIFSVPAMEADRYYVFQLWDPNGDTFEYLGSRTRGTTGGSYALVGPDFKGALPKGVIKIACPYNTFVIWGRIGTKGNNDEAKVHAIQDNLRLTPLSMYGKSKEQVAPDMAFSASRVALNIPSDLPDSLLIYYKIAEALKHTPPKAQDSVVFESLSQIGFKDNGTSFDYKSLTEAQKEGLAKGAQFAMHLMDVNAQSVGTAINGWRWSPRSGIMGNDYLFRAAWAKWYTGGNSAEEAIYMDGRTDDKKQPFDASKSYTMHFNKGGQPRVKAFWSLSMYNIGDGSFAANSINRYSIGNNTEGLVTNPDGSLDLYIQTTAPTDPAKKANWLPTPASGGFYMDLRLYNPDNSLQNGTWAPPPVKVVE